MSSQRKILKNLITNALISSSMATCMLTTGSAFASGSPTVNRTASGVAANLFTGVGLDSGVAFNPVTSVLTINNVDVNTGGIDNIPSIFSLNPQTLNVDNNLTLGAVGGARLNLNITGDYLITWNGNGVSATAGANTKDQAGNASPFGEVGGPYGLDDNTFSVGNMNFNNKVATFDIYTTNNGSIIDQNTVFQQAGSATLSVTNTIPDNGTTILHPSVTQFDTLQINGTVTARLLPNIAGDFNAYPADLNVIFNPVFFNKNNIIDARFGIGNSDTTGGALNPRSYTADPGHTITSGTDGYGLVAFNSGPNGQQRIVDINVGTNNSQRLGQVTIEDIQGGQTGIITVNGTMFAQTILLATNYNAGNGIIWTSAIDTGDGGVVKIDLQSNVLFQNNITSNINFVSNDASFVTMDDGFNVTGNIYKTGTGATTLNFAGISTVTGDIGGNNGIGDNNTGSYPIDVLNIQGDDTTTVELKGNTTVNQFNFTDTGMAAVGGTLTATVGVNFNNVASTLQFNGALGAGPYTFSSPVLNAANGILDVYTNLITTDASIGTLATINIGDVGNKIDGTLTITVPGDNFVLGGAVDIDTAGSQLIIAIPEAQTVTFNQNVTNTTAAQGGSVTFDGTNGELVVDGAATIGAVNNLNAINTKGAVQVQPGLNVGGTAALNLKAGSTFTDNSLTSTNIAAISIGEAGGVATYALDAINDAGGAFNLNTGGMTFGNAASILQLQSSALAGADTTITLLGNLNPGNVGGAGGTGIIAINAINAGETLKIAGAGSLGIAGGNLLQQMTFAGAGNITVVPTINTANAISTGITGTLTLGTVNSNINFTAATNLIVGNVTGNIGLAGQAGIVTLLNNSTITGTVDGSTTAILNFQGAGNVGAIGANNTLTAVNFQGAGDVNLTGVANATNFSITNGANVTVTGLMTGAVNYGAGAGALTLQSGLNGAITTSVPNNGTVTINGGNISGIIDGTTLVNIGANPVTFSANVNSTTVALTNNASSLTIGNNVTLTSAVTTANPNNGVLILNPNSSVVGDIGTNLAPIAAVQIGAGPASLQGNVYSGAAALTNALSSLTLNAGTNVNGSITNTSGNNNSGILIFNGGSITGAAGAPGAALSAVTFNANGALPIASYAQTFNVNNAAVANAPNGVTGDVLVNSGTYIGNIAGNATFGGVGTITTTTITGQTNFNGLGGTVTVNDTGSIGAVTSSGNNGNLIFAGGANVTGIVSNIGAMTLNGAAGSIVNFQQNVSGASLALNNGGTANLSGSLTTTGNVDFNKAASILRFSGGSPAGYQLNSPIANANNGVLNVFTNLTATDPTIGQIKTITIGNGAAQIFTISTSSPALTLLQPAGSTIIFGDAGSTFAITSSQNQGVAFANSFDGFAGGGGILQLGSTSATTPNNNVLYLQGTAGTEAIGSKANQLTSINIVGNVGIAGISPTTKQLDVSNTKALNISAGSVFADESITSAQIKAINIGDNTGAGTYALDAVNADFTLQAAGVTFGNEDSVFKLMTSATAANSTSTIILDYNIVPLAPHTAIVELNAKNPGVTLKIEGTANKYSLGTKALPLKQINFSGNGLIAVEAIATDTINISVPKLLIGEVNSNIIYSGPTELGVVTVNGDMDFQNNAGTAVFASDTTNPNNIIPASISGDITSTGGPGPNGTVIAMDNLTVGGTVTNINSFQGGADGSTVTFNAPDTGNGVTMSATELKGTGAGTMVLAQNTTFTGNINESSDAKPVNLEFPNGGTILGNMGNGAPVGNVTVTSGTLNLGVPNSVPDSVMRGDTLYVDFNNASVVFNTSDILFSGGIDQAPIAPIALRAFVPGALVAPAPIITGKGAFFKDTDPVITSAPIGKTAPIPIYIQGGDVTLTNNIVNISSANFTTPNAVTLTINSSNAQLGGATTNADDLHTIAISGDLTTGKNPFGDPTNSLKSVKLLTSGKITIDSENFYSGITTGTNNTGTAVFDADNGFTDDLGEESARLDTVQFNSVNGKVKGDTYSKTITIDSGKSAIFAGYKDRTLDVPAANVNGTQIPRSIQKFKYNTVVAGDSFIGADASSNGTFSNPALVQVPINKGTYKFDNDVWLQKPLTGASDITFAPNRVSIIGAEVEAVNIGANQANLVFLASAPLSGNISGSNMTLDLGNNQITYTGNAKPTGELTINVLYDTVNSGAKNNTDSGNIVIANGSNIDLSGVTALKVLLTAASNAASISENSAYPIITSLSGNGITVGNAGKLPFNVTANEGVFVRWVINASSFTLYPIESTGDVVTDNIIKILINTPIGNVIVNTPVDQRKVIVDHLIPIIPLPSNEVHKITQVNHPFIIPEIPSIAPIGGYSPSVPVNGPAVVGTGPNGPNSPVIGGSVIGGTFTPSGPSVVYPSGPAVVGTGPNGPNVPSAPSTVTPGTGGVTGYSPSTPSGPGTVTPGTGGVTGYSPSTPGTGGTGGVTGYSPSTPSGPGTVTPGTGGVTGYSPSTPGTGGTGGVTGYSPSTPSGPSAITPGAGGVTIYSPSTPGTGGTGGVTGYSPSTPGTGGTGGVTGYSPSTPSGPGTVTPGTGGVTGYSPSTPGTGGTGGVTGYSPSTPSGPGTVTPGTGGVTGYSPSTPGTGGTGGVTGYSPSTPSGPSAITPGAGGVTIYSPSTPGTGGTGGVTSYSPSAPGSVTGGSVGTGGTSVNSPAVGGSSVNPGSGGYAPSIGGAGGTSVNSPAVGGSSVNPGSGGYAPSIGGAGGTSVNGPATGGSSVNPGSGGYAPSIGGAGGTSVNSPAVGGSSVNPGSGGYAPSIGGAGGTSVNSPAVGGSSVNPGSGGYAPSIGGAGGTSVNSPAVGGSSVNPGSGGYAPSIGGAGGTSVNSPAVGGSSVNPGSGGYAPSIGGAGGTSVNGPATGGSSVNPGSGGYAPSIGGAGGTSVNGPATGGSSVNPGSGGYAPSIGGAGGTSVNSPAVGGSSVNPGSGGYAPSIGSTSNSPSGFGGSNTGNSGVQGGNIGNSGVSPNASSSTGANIGTSGRSGNNAGTSATSSSGATIGNTNIPASTSNSTGSNTFGGSSTNTNNGNIGSSRVGGSSNNAMPVIETGRDNSISSSSSVGSSAASTGAVTTNPNDGFNAARSNTNAGTQDISERTSKIRGAESSSDSVPAEQDQGVSRRRGEAVGAGDCDSNEVAYGLWGAPYLGRATQKAQHNLMGYKTKSVGGSIGVDALINDNIVAGAAYTKVDTKLNYQGAKAGNHTKVNTDMFSIYGLYNFVNNLFIEGITSYSRSTIKTQEIRNIINGLENARSKYRSYSYSGQVVGGYNYLWNETTLSPMVGLRLAKIKDTGHQEYGTSFQNLTIKRRQYNKLEGIAGGEIKTTFYKGEFLIRPQVHAFINYDFKGKTPPVVAELSGVKNPLPVPTPKSTKILYDLGAGIEIKKGRMEYGFHYGLNLAKKYQAQSGTLKLKINL